MKARNSFAQAVAPFLLVPAISAAEVTNLNVEPVEQDNAHSIVLSSENEGALSFSCDTDLSEFSKVEKQQYALRAVTKITTMTQPSLVNRGGMMVMVPPVPGGSGSGFVFDAEQRLIATNHHVTDDSSAVYVSFYDPESRSDTGHRIIASKVGYNEEYDLSVLKIDAEQPLPYDNCLTFADSASVTLGQTVTAVGQRSPKLGRQRLQVQIQMK